MRANRNVLAVATALFAANCLVMADRFYFSLPLFIPCSSDVSPHISGLEASLVAQLVKNLPALWETWIQSLAWEETPGEGNGTPLQYSCLENPMDREAWWATGHSITKSRTRLSS